MSLRTRRKMGARRIQSELARLHGISFSLATMHKVLVRHQVKSHVYRRRRGQQNKRYTRPTPGDRVQMDTRSWNQYMAVGDCTTYCVPAIFERRAAGNTQKFL